MSMLQLSEVRFRYDSKAPWAVDGVSFALGRGEVFGLLGPNGAGKSTLMALMAGLVQPEQGHIRRDPVVAASGGFALVPQDYAFYPMLTCRENVRFFAGVLGLSGKCAQARTAAALAMVGLDNIAQRRADECSGGQKRRLNLAIGLVGRPALLLLDEPTVGVDPQSRAFLLDMVRQLKQAGTTVIYTSHYMEEVQQVSDRVGILDHGQLLCCGTLDELLRQESSVLEVHLTESPSAALLAEFDTRLDRPHEPGSRVLTIAMGPGLLVDKVLRRLREQGASVLKVKYGCGNLEELFLRLTDRSLRDG